MEHYEDPDRPLNYHYKSINNSILDKYVLNHWWNLAFKALPKTIPANLVSMLGNVGSWSAFILLTRIPLGPKGLKGGPRESWIFFVAALCIAFYHTLDALDGKQARRSGTSGPLGEFVDHWFDSFNAFLFPLGLVLAFPSVGCPFDLLIVYILCVSDFLALEEVRKTGILVFDPLSADEGVFFDILLLLAIGFLGYDFWATPTRLGISPIHIVLLASSSAILFVCIKSLIKIKSIDRILVQALCLFPIGIWTFYCHEDAGRPVLLCGGLLLGLTASRFAGEVLRERLLGTKYPYFPIDLPILDALLLASVLLPNAGPRVGIFMGWAAITWTLLCLLLQFSRTVSRVEEVTGIGLWGPLRPYNAFAMARSRRGMERTRDAIREFIKRR